MFLKNVRSFFLKNIYRVFNILSRKARFENALRLSAFITPIVCKLPRYKQPDFALGTDREYVTSAVLHSLTIHNVEFDPVVYTEGAQLIPERGAIFLTGHFYLNFIFLRYLFDKGRVPNAFLLTGIDNWQLMGTRERVKILMPQKTSLLQVKTLIGSGELVLAAIDHKSLHGFWNKKLSVSEREIYVSDSLIKFAEMGNVPIFFFDTDFDEKGNVVSVIEAASSTNSSVVLDEFSDFISRALKKRK